MTDCLGKLKRTSNASFLLKTGLGDAVRQEWNTEGVREGLGMRQRALQS